MRDAASVSSTQILWVTGDGAESSERSPQQILETNSAGGSQSLDPSHPGSDVEAANESHWKIALRWGLVFTAGVLLTIGPWLLKNLAETGNPVYPLLYSVFGGRDWDAELNAKWKAGHSPDNHSPVDLAVKFVDVTLKSDWLSPLLFGWIMDQSMPHWVFGASVIFMVMTVLLALVTDRKPQGASETLSKT